MFVGFLEIDKLPADGRRRPLELRVLVGRGRRLEKDKVMRPVRFPVRVPEIGDHAVGAHQMKIVLPVVVPLGRLPQLSPLVQGVGIADERIEPDAVVMGGVLDLPDTPVVVAERPALHLPDSRSRIAGQSPDGPGQALRPERRAVHRSPFLGAQQVLHAVGDLVLELFVLFGRELSETMEDLVAPDEFHGREEIRKHRDPVRVISPLGPGPIRHGRTEVSVRQAGLFSPGRRRPAFSPFQRGKRRSRPSPEARRAPCSRRRSPGRTSSATGEKLVGMAVHPVGGRPGVSPDTGQAARPPRRGHGGRRPTGEGAQEKKPSARAVRRRCQGQRWRSWPETA